MVLYAVPDSEGFECLPWGGRRSQKSTGRKRTPEILAARIPAGQKPEKPGQRAVEGTRKGRAGGHERQIGRTLKRKDAEKQELPDVKQSKLERAKGLNTYEDKEDNEEKNRRPDTETMQKIRQCECE